MNNEANIWAKVRDIGKSEGATEWAMQKWAVRGIPAAWQIKIVNASDGMISFDDLGSFGKSASEQVAQ